MSPNDPRHTARAVVDAGATTTSYLRAGHGSVVLLLFPPETPLHSLQPLIEELSVTMRVIAPDVPDLTDVPFALWMRAFLDGLGLSRVHFVAHESLAKDAAVFAKANGAALTILPSVVPTASEVTRAVAAILRGVRDHACES